MEKKMNSERRSACEQVLKEVARENGFQDPQLVLEAGSKKGDNFVGEMLRCIITDKNNASKKLHLMAKIPPENEIHRAKYRADDFFKIEANMYDIVLPTLAECFKKRKILEETDVFPGTARSYAARADEKEMIIVMEDLGHRGFVMQDRKIGLDVGHCRLVLQKLGSLHAASLVLQKENPELHEKLVGHLQEIVFAGRVPPSYIKAMESATSLINDRFPKGTIEREKFDQYAEKNTEILLISAKRNSTFCCITHGDLWINNILFKYKPDSTEPVDVCFVDLQISRMASPILDLSYFFCLCTRKDTRKSFHALIKVYYDSLSKQLLDLGHDPDSIIPWTLFQDELHKYFGFGWGNAVRILPNSLIDEQALKDFDKQFERNNKEGSSLVMPHNTDYLKTVFSDLLEDLVRLELI